MQEKLQFGPFTMDPAARVLSRRGERIPLRRRTFDVLLCLIENRAGLVERRHLLDTIWGDSDVCESNLSTCIAELRHALDDSPRAPEFIATVPRRGYRFVGNVENDESGLPDDAILDVAPIGCSAPWGRLQEAAQAARDGRQQVVFLSGEAGIGKTSLVDSFLTATRMMSPVRVARGHCLVGQVGTEPFLAIADAMNDLLQSSTDSATEPIIRRWCPEIVLAHGTGRGASGREPTLHRIVGAIEELAQQSLLVLVLDDLQWADSSTIDLVSTLAWRRKAPHLLLIGSARRDSDPRSRQPLMQVMAELLIRNLAMELTLDRWSVADVTELLARQGELDWSADEIAALHTQSDGNPLFLKLLLESPHKRSLRQTSRAPMEENQDPARQPPQGLRRIVEADLIALPRRARDVLDALSTAGNRASSPLLAAVIGLEEEEIEQTCMALAARGLLQADHAEESLMGTTGGHFAFCHNAYAEVVQASLGSTRRQWLQQRVDAFRWKDAAARRKESVDVAIDAVEHVPSYEPRDL